MKYKVGDKVKIKTWEKMEKEYGLNVGGEYDGEINFGSYHFTKKREKYLNDISPDRIVEISSVNKTYNLYRIKNIL